MAYAGFWQRFFAFFIDSILVFLLGVIVGLLTSGSIAAGIVISLFYQPFFESSALQGTPGKALMGLRVTDLQGGRVTFKKAAIRFVMHFFSGFFLCIGYVMMLFTEKKQTLHDMVAETVVVEGGVKDLNYFQAWYQQVLFVFGMVDKSSETKSEATGYHASSSGEASPADLAEYYELYRKGVLTEAEYNQKKEELLKKL